MKNFWFLFVCVFSAVLLAWCCKCPCSEKMESVNEPEFLVTDFDSAMTAFYNWWSFTCDFSWDIDERFMGGYVAADWNRVSAYANWDDNFSKGEGHLIIKNWLSFQWTKEQGEIEWEVDEGWVEDIFDFLDELREAVENSKDWEWKSFFIDCKSWVEESDFIVPGGIQFDYY